MAGTADAMGASGGGGGGSSGGGASTPEPDLSPLGPVLPRGLFSQAGDRAESERCIAGRAAVGVTMVACVPGGTGIVRVGVALAGVAGRVAVGGTCGSDEEEVPGEEPGKAGGGRFGAGDPDLGGVATTRDGTADTEVGEETR